MPDIHELYIQRCIDLALLGAGTVAPNPMVGAVLVYDNRIIGEGYHRQYGQAHAEVNCINSVKEDDQALIPQATLYVSLEPCAHFGKTPPCSDLIIKNGIGKVFIGCRDPFTEVNGKGIEKLQKAGIAVVTGILENSCRKLNRRFFTFHTKKRPWIVLKWAQTGDGKMAGAGNERLLISNEITNRLVHQWRSEEAAILIGTNTALKDNPSLNNRLFNGPSPVRLLLDLSLRLPATLQLFDRKHKTIVLNFLKDGGNDNLFFYKLNERNNIPQQVSKACYELNLQSILIEGGAQLLQSFIDQDLWDEARIITNEQLLIGDGLAAPSLKVHPSKRDKLSSDTISYYTNKRINQ